MASFAIVGTGDVPLYRADFEIKGLEEKARDKVSVEIALHSSLDMMDDVMWQTSSKMLRGPLAQYSDFAVFGYVGASGVRMLLLIDGSRTASEDAMRNFFTQATESYTRAICNPFQNRDAPIFARLFDRLIRSSFEQCLQPALARSSAG